MICLKDIITYILTGITIVVSITTLIFTIRYEKKHIQEANLIERKRIAISAIPKAVFIWKNLCSNTILSGRNIAFENEPTKQLLKVLIFFNSKGVEYLERVKFRNLCVSKHEKNGKYPNGIIECLETDFLKINFVNKEYFYAELHFHLKVII